MDEFDLKQRAAAEAQFKAAVHALADIDPFLVAMIPVFTSEVNVERDPSEDGIDEALIALQRRAFEQRCDECGTLFSILRMKMDYTHIGRHGRWEVLDKLRDHTERHVEAGQCPTNVTGDLPFGPVRLFEPKARRAERGDVLLAMLGLCVISAAVLLFLGIVLS